jgi:hypothetical protein
VKKMLWTWLFIKEQVSCCMVLKWLSDAILIMKNVFFSKIFDAELMCRTAAIHLSCYENNFSELDFWLQKVEKTIPLSIFEKNDEEIFFDLRLFSGAGINNMQEKPVKTISDVKILLSTRFFITKQVNCCMVLMWLSDAILIIKNEFFSKTFDAELMLRTTAVYLSCFENNFSEIDFWLQKVEKTIPFLYLRKIMKKYFSILCYFLLRAWIKRKKHSLKRYPMWRKCI